MDKRQLARTVIGMMLAFAIILYYKPVINYIGTMLGYDMTERTIPDSTTQPSSQPTTSAAPTTTAAATATLHAVPATQAAADVQLGSAAKNDPHYKMAVNISAKGAGLESVILNEFKRTTDVDDRYIFQTPYAEAIDASRPLATRSITVNGSTVDLSQALWILEKSDTQSATYSIPIMDGGKPILKISKTYQLLPASDPSLGYEIVVSQTFENQSDGELKNFQVAFNGPTVPPREQERGGERQALAGYVIKGGIEVAHDPIENFTEKIPTKDYTKDKDGNPLIWAGAMSSYFQAIARPVALTDPNAPPPYIGNVTAKLMNPGAPEAADHDINISFATTDLSIPAGKSLSLPVRVFLGPRQRSLLNSSYYASFPAVYNSTLVLTSGPCGVCTFQWLINWLVMLLGFFHLILRDWGLAIIALVILVRAILHPITKRSQISMAKMGKMGPEMERLRKKHGDNKEELSKAMWELQKEQGVGPYLGCLPMFLQMPIWIALWQALYTTFELRQAPFLWGWTWIHDLSKPDHLLTWTPILLPFGFKLSGFNILPILMGIVFVFQMKYQQPKTATMTKEQEQQQKMMMWLMPIMFPLMLYTGPSGLNLYILTSTFIGIIESKVVRDHIKQREEAEKAGRVIVDAGKKFKGGGGSTSLGKPAKPKSGGIMGWIASMQEKADQIRREAEKKGK